MPQYMVTMNLLKADPLLDLGQLTDIVTDKILPSLEALKDLQSKGKVLAGGHRSAALRCVVHGGGV